MNRFSMWLAQFMQGRYGMDNLNRFLLMVGLVLIVADWILRWRILDLLTLVVLVLVYFRMFSRNMNGRYRENCMFMEFSGRFRNRSAAGFGGRQPGSRFTVVKDKNHKILNCPGCGEKLRVPKGAGTIMISCPHCHTKFQKTV